MAKSFIDAVQDSPRTGLAIPVKTQNPISRTNTPPANSLSASNFAGDWFQLKVAYDYSVIRSPGALIRGHTPVWETDKPRQPGEK